MGLVRRFEDLEAWKEARQLTSSVYRLARVSPVRVDPGLADQMRRAAVSTMNNIAEGFDSASRTEFRRFLRYAIRSASEIQSCLYVAMDQHWIDEVTFAAVYAEARSVRRLCSGLVRRLGSYGKGSGGGEGMVREAGYSYDRLTGSPAHRLTPLS
ncbi:MAG: four helix bundle protein [Deltaproteobacteria bacterium]|nr:four helix bundle protein [Deltaproteobacteria bacterium]